ncbi:hypothetical protein NVP1187O_087 [Vibrio phage 1.187.O._10N.286.49.F1]|nr:hypothetical protein NVP1187O_087 [Vibrio phage 1.187.O._10N.286.49.F1]
MLNFEDKKSRLEGRLESVSPEDLYTKLKSYSNNLKINSLMQVVCIDTEVVYGNLFRAEDESIYFRKSWYIEDLADCEQKQIDKILKGINHG